MNRPRTAVFLHAHPDDEALLTGGTIARLTDEGHRVVLVVATDGERGLTAARGELGELRRQELDRAARALGCAAVVRLGHPDTGTDPASAGPDAFSRLPVEPIAQQVADVLRSERADVLCGYDAAGGYGHPDHRQVHRVARRAAGLAGTPVLLEATVDRRFLVAALRAAAPWLPREPQYRAAALRERFAAPTDITHCVAVGRYAGAKQQALRAHASQASGGEQERLISWLLRLPPPVFALVLGHEWFAEIGRRRGRRRSRDLLDGLPEHENEKLLPS